MRLTTLGRRVYSDSLMRMKDPWGREIFWIGGGSAAWTGGDDSDFRAVQDGYISVTPLHLDLTHYKMLATSQAWWGVP
jgi:5'-nucleotidase